ncbi:MAG: NAD(P)/FAD-dependent oxidoreductase [Phenylobacterium sp.]|uniref:NAD(P)/FAD-dependent oxidoreductase n=1 Tax=Phenylobacterium sp. TaxID=1871053 RepID=UPI001A5973D4|nr:NAD(P)/FAD-dependent oxidoreductase [Phenylobacterium sp.]MBL8770237.1 NAD(P)/FAD-dependent oxidoreductase [Phenylobacterium sp.]
MSTPRQRVVIVGAGFGGLTAAAKLARTDADVTLIDRRNHHLFQPLLYQVATAGLAPTQIASPVRMILRRQPNVHIELDEVTGVDLAGRQLRLGDRTIPYDQLIVATGATHAYFGRDGWAEHAPGLKSLEDALALRSRVLLALESAELDMDPAARERLLTFVVVGGGPTGVELAGAIAELTRRALACDFRRIRGQRARILLIDSGPRVLSTFCPSLSAYAKGALEKLGVELMQGRPVGHVEAQAVTVGDTRIEAATIVWAAGVQASPAGRWLAAETDRAGRVIVDADLSLPRHPDVFVIGDVARMPDGRGGVAPGVAPAAKQAGAYVAKLIDARAHGRASPGPFRYANYGSLATIGRKAAVADLGPVKLRGFLAWIFWCAAHVWFLIGFRNRVQVVLDWLWSYLTFERGARLVFEAVTRSREIRVVSPPVEVRTAS